jgi:A/G-specific adenine glycosylase
MAYRRSVAAPTAVNPAAVVVPATVAPAAVPSELRAAILEWYAAQGRTLSFRGTDDPYAILVSEAMAQQTQAARAGEAWIRFMALFPTVAALAAAAPADVLRAWQGLGYNRRALNLWRAARRIVDEFGGRVPSDLGELQSLPGVGPYTARAIAAIGFGMPVGAVDTNVRRVLGRIVAGDAATLGAARLQAVADAAVPPGQPGAWTHALMDLGATVCKPQRPECDVCPARSWCRFAADPKARVDGRTVRHVRPDRARETAAPFRTTSRWLRGRILDRLREAPNGTWVTLAGPIGDHDSDALDVAIHALATEGLVELDGTPHNEVLRRRTTAPRRPRARLPIS